MQRVSTLICADIGNIANSGPLVLLLKSSAVPAPRAAVVLLPAVDQRVLASVAQPVRVNGVRNGMVIAAGAVTTGMALPVAVTRRPCS